MVCSGCASTGNVAENSVSLTELPAYTPTGEEPKVAVFDFENGSFFESKTIGPGVSAMFQTALVRSRRFRVIDRANISRIMDEYKLGMSGLTSMDVSSLGQQLGVDYLITGNITEFGIKKIGTSVGVGALDVNSYSGGGATVGKQRGTARIVIDIKITEIKSGRIIYMETSTGEAFSDNVNVGMAILLDTGVAVGGTVGSGVQGFDETIAGKAARVAANQMVKQLIDENIFSK